MDDDIIGTRVRAAFESVPVPSEAQLLGSSHERAGVRFAPLALFAVALAGGLIWLTFGTPSNYVDAWQAVPRAQDSWIIARAEQACGNGANPDKSDSSAPLDAGLPLSLVDARGNNAVAFFTDGERFATCQFSWDRNGTPQTAVAGQGGMVGSSTRLDVITARVNPDGAALMVVGHAGTASQVGIDLGTGTSVKASAAHGYYLAWWPEPNVIARITGTDANGQVVSILEHPLAP